MDFDEAIKSHTFWKVTLRWMIRGQHRVDGEKLERDDACEIGKWLRADGSKHSGCPAYQTLVREHAEFHTRAGAVARTLSEGNSEAALVMMSEQGEFAQASERTIAAIRQLQREVEDAAGRKQN